MGVASAASRRARMTDMARRRLPPDPSAPDEWDGPVHGEPGVLAVEPDGGRVQCHACGRWFRFLASHVTQIHRLTADEYRAVFGLRTRTGLMSPAMKERRREQT